MASNPNTEAVIIRNNMTHMMCQQAKRLEEHNSPGLQWACVPKDEAERNPQFIG